MAKADLTAERLREVVNYDPNTGSFVWLPAAREGRRGRAVVGGEAGNTSLGYRRIRIDGELYLAHRLAWKYVYGDWPTSMLDHINGIKADNRIGNLREATSVSNAQNIRKPHCDSSSGFLGVVIHKHSGLWQAGIGVNGKRKGLGYFKTPEEAHKAYLEAKRRLHDGCTL